MKRVIKSFLKFPEGYQEEIYALYQDGELNKATFPFNGSIEDGVIYVDEEVTFLIPISTIKASKMSSSAEDDDDDDLDNDNDDLDIGDDIDDVDDEE